MWAVEHSVCDFGAGESERPDGLVALFHLMLRRGEVEIGAILGVQWGAWNV